MIDFDDGEFVRSLLKILFKQVEENDRLLNDNYELEKRVIKGKTILCSMIYPKKGKTIRLLPNFCSIINETLFGT